MSVILSNINNMKDVVLKSESVRSQHLVSFIWVDKWKHFLWECKISKKKIAQTQSEKQKKKTDESLKTKASIHWNVRNMES